MRRVKILVTLGPATATAERIRELVQAGADAVRLNFSHGSHEQHKKLIEMVRRVSRDLDRHITIAQDLQGPKIRVKGLADGASIPLVPGKEVVIGEGGLFSISYDGLHRVVVEGSRILLDDGRMEMKVLSVDGQQIRCRVIRGGLLGANKGVNLPGVPIDIPSLTDKDRDDLEFGLSLGVDWIAMSFVRRPEDVRPLRDVMRRQRVHVPVLAKIEKPEALHNLNGVLRVFDGIMVARGDLGVELSPEEVPIWQKTMIREARRLGKLSIVATQMLESMIQNPQPTRAEASDVANAVLDGADAVMLSGETAVGSYPLEAVTVMRQIIEKTEASYPPHRAKDEKAVGTAKAVAEAACLLAGDLPSRALAVMTRSGMTAHLVSAGRPAVPIIAFTTKPELARQLNLWWGITPLVMEFQSSAEATIARMQEALLQRGLASSDDYVIVVGSTPLAAHGRTNFLKVHRIEDVIP